MVNATRKGCRGSSQKTRSRQDCPSVAQDPVPVLLLAVPRCSATGQAQCFRGPAPENRSGPVLSRSTPEEHKPPCFIACIPHRLRRSLGIFSFALDSSVRLGIGHEIVPIPMSDPILLIVTGSLALRDGKIEPFAQ